MRAICDRVRTQRASLSARFAGIGQFLSRRDSLGSADHRLSFAIDRDEKPGLEFYGALGLVDDTDPLQAQQHLHLPVLRGSFQSGIEYSLGPGLGLTRGSDRVLIKFNLELDHFIGALF